MPMLATFPLLINQTMTGLNYQLRRPLRTHVLRKITVPDFTDGWPAASLQLDLSLTAAYWEARLAGAELLLPNLPGISVEPSNPSASPLIDITAAAKGDIADDSLHFRLVVSVPRGDHVFYLKVGQNPATFLSRHFGALFNGEGDVTTMGGLTGPMDPVVDWRAALAPARWWRVSNASSYVAPSAGETVAYVYADLDEVARASSGAVHPYVGPLPEHGMLSWASWRTHQRHVAVYFPPAKRLRVNRYRGMHTRSSGGGGGERGGGSESECHYITSRIEGEVDHQLSPREVIEMLHWEELTLSQKWAKQGSGGTVLFFEISDPMRPT